MANERRGGRWYYFRCTSCNRVQERYRNARRCSCGGKLRRIGTVTEEK